ncbi:MAG: hypothetical protein ACM3SY_08035 [Candidatus Omnitrophota bacterium]
MKTQSIPCLVLGCFVLCFVFLFTARISGAPALPNTLEKRVLCVDRPTLDPITQKQLDVLLKIPAYAEALTPENVSSPGGREIRRKIGSLLRDAAQIEPDACHKQYLTALAGHVSEGRFHVREPEWLSLKTNTVEILFIPASGTNRVVDVYIYVNDREETLRVEEYARQFNRLQEKLPGKRVSYVSVTNRAPSVKIARLIYASLPHGFGVVYPGPDIAMTAGYAYKIIVFKNLIDTYAENILTQVGERAIDNYNSFLLAGQNLVDPESVLSTLVMHKIAHHYGNFFKLIPKKGQPNASELKLISDAFGESFPKIEELKADVVSIFCVPALKEMGLIAPDQDISIYTTYVVSLLDRLRKNAGKSSADTFQFNYLFKKRAIAFNANTKKLVIQFPYLVSAIEELTKLSLEDWEPLAQSINRNPTLEPELAGILDGLSDIPSGVYFQFSASARAR